MEASREFDGLLARARSAYHRLEPEVAAQCLDEVQQRIDRADFAPGEPTRGWVLVWRGRVAEQRGDFATAQQVASRAVSIARDVDWPEVRAHSLILLARVLLARGDEVGAEPVARRALAAFRSLETPHDAAYAGLTLGRVFMEQGRLDEAEVLLEDAVATLRGASDPRAAEAAITWAEGRRRRGDVAQAEQILQDTLAALGHDALRDRLAVWTALASTAMSAGRFDAATEWARRAQEAWPATESHTVIGSRIHNIVGETRRIAGDLDGAEAAYRQAIAGGEGLSHVVQARVNLSLIAITRRDWATAGAQLDTVIAQDRRRGVRALTHSIRLAVCAGQNDERGWQHHYARSRALLRESGAADRDVAEAVRRAGQLWAEAGDDARTLGRAMRAHAIALEQWTHLGNVEEAERERELLRACGERGAPTPAGPWDLGEALGRGAMGEVYHARHHVRGFEAAVKVLLAEAGPDSLLRAGIDSEVASVAALDHPNIVRVLDHGALDEVPDALGGTDDRLDVPFFAMELARGGTLDDLIGKLSWPAVRDVLANLLDALAHAHARDVIHLDMKPANVLLDWTADGALHPRLTDFGVAGVIQALRGVRGVVGTPQYMAPEQCTGRVNQFGPWTDLYALGCMAVHLVTGAPPFPGESITELRQAHLTAEPPPLRPRIAVPDGFEAWIGRLLEKAPGDRYQRAADAAWALSRLPEADPTSATHRTSTPVRTSASTWALPSWADPDEVPETQQSGPIVRDDDVPPMPSGWRGPPRPPPTSAALALSLVHLRRVPVVGRDGQRRLLWATLADVRRHRRPRLIALEGPQGSGRSALMRWMCEAAHERGAAEILDAECWGDGLRQLLLDRFRAGHLDEEGVERRIRAMLPSSVSEADTDALVAHAIGAPDALSLDAIAAVVAEAASPRPAILALAGEPLHEEQVMELVEHLAQADAAVLILVEVSDARDPRTNRRYDALLDLGNTMELPVDLPSRRLVGDIVREQLPLDADLVTAVVDRAEGNLHYAKALVSDLAERDALVEGPTGLMLRQGFVLELPEPLHVEYTQRLEAALAGQSDAARDALTVCALAGVDVAPDVWRAVCDRVGLTAPSAVMRRLRGHRLVTPTADRGWAFGHPALYQLLRSNLADPGHLADLAGLAAELFEIDDPARLGELLLDAGQLEGALQPLLDAANAAFDRMELAEGDRLLARRADGLRGLGVGADDARWVEHLVLAAEIATLRGTAGAMRDELLHAAELAGRLELHSLHARALLRCAELARQAGDLAASERNLRDAAAAFRRAEDPDGWARVRHHLALDALWRGDVDGATLHLEKGLARVQNPDVASALRLGMAWVLAWREDDGGARAAFTAELPVAVKQETTRIEVECHTGLGLLAVRRGELAEAETHYAHALRATPPAASDWRLGIELDRCLIPLARGDLQGAATEAERLRAWSGDSLVPELDAWSRVLGAPARVVEEGGTVWIDAMASALRRSMLVTPDVAGVLEIAARCAEGAQRPGRARRLWELVMAQWRTLGSQERSRYARQRAKAAR